MCNSYKTRSMIKLNHLIVASYVARDTAHKIVFIPADVAALDTPVFR